MASKSSFFVGGCPLCADKPKKVGVPYYYKIIIIFTIITIMIINYIPANVALIITLDESHLSTNPSIVIVKIKNRINT